MSGISVTELIEMIVDHLRDDKLTLSSCAVVAKTWLPRSRYHLFRTIKIIVRTPSGTEELSDAAAFFSATPSVCGYVRRTHIRVAENVAMFPAVSPELEVVQRFFTNLQRLQEEVDLRQLSTLARSTPNLFSMDLDGVYPVYRAHDLAARIEELRVPSLRKLILREAHVPLLSLESCFCNLSQLFPSLEELSMINLGFEAPPFGFPALSGDLPVTKLLIRGVSGLLGVLPSTAFRNVTRLELPRVLLALPGIAQYLIPLAAVLEHLTLSIGRFGIAHIPAFASQPEPAFELETCPRLRSIHFLQLNPMAGGITSSFHLDINSILQVAPLGLRRVTITLLKYEDSETAMQDVIDQWDWDQKQRLLQRFQYLESLTITIFRQTTPPSREADIVELESMTPQLQSYVRDKFERDFWGKLRFE